MKTIIRNLLLAAMLIAFSLQIHAQGLVYDQQSAANGVSLYDNYVDGLYIQPEPLTQSFIATLSAVDFIQLEFEDVPSNGNNGATVYVNLWTSSPNINSATLIGSTTPVYMPDGFMNTGLGGGGVTNFYFSTSIALTAGQTYYLQPVVRSGDNPWAIVTIGDTYPNGQLYGSGAFFQPSTDLWFREGVVPEPSTLVLFGLSCILAYTFKRRSKLVVLLLFAVSVLSVHAASDSVVQVTAEAAGLTSVSATTLPRIGTFWVITTGSNGKLTELPYPMLPPSLSGLPAFSVTGNIFIVDDTGGQLLPPSTERMSSAQATSTAQTQAATMAGLIERILYPANSGDGGLQFNYNFSFDTNGLWLEASNGVTNLGLRLHNTIGGDDYQLLSTTNLLNSHWDLGEILLGASDGQADFSSVPMTNTMTFYRAHHANPAMAISDGQDSKEFDPTNTSDPGHAGYIYIQDEISATNDVTVYYSIGGTAQNGVDYSNLTGVAVVPVSSSYAEIDIEPIEVGLNPDKTITLTLLQNTNYLIDPSYLSATNTLYANPEVVPMARGDIQTLCPNFSKTFFLEGHDAQGLLLDNYSNYIVVTWPIHGTLDTSALPQVTYTSTNCYEGEDSFTFKVSDGQYDSAPATVNLTISSSLYANPVSAQTCRGTRVQFTLDGGDACDTPGYQVATPLEGTVTNVSGQYYYIPNGTNFTGTDTFNYTVSDSCGDTAMNTVTITVGDASLQPNGQSVMTGTNQPIIITLSASDGDACQDDTNDYTYTITSSPTNGTLIGTPPHLTYTPTNGEGMDSFQFNVSDGALSSMFPATVTIYVVAGPILATECDPFGTAVQLNWSLDETVSNMWQQDGLNISDFIVYRTGISGGPYTPVYTNYDTSQMSYLDTNVVVGQTNYYVVNFESHDYSTGVTYESPFSNEIEASGRNPDDLIPANAVWQVATNLNDPTNVVSMRAPFSSEYPNQYETLYPLPNTYWPAATNGVYSTWTNHITLYVPTNTALSQVQYSIAIDNVYWLYVNGAYIDTENNNGAFAVWSAFQAFPTNTLHYGTNDIVVGIQDWGSIDYFSMVVTTNTCGW